MKALSALLWGLILATSPAPFGTELCTTGRAPDCCRATGSVAPSSPRGDAEVRRAACDCCVTIDSLPIEFGAGSGTVAAFVAARIPVAHAVPTASPSRCVATLDAFGARDARPPSLRSPVLLI